jgi:hypothetical protein
MNEIDLNEFLQLIIRDKGGTPQQYNQLMDYIAYHETGPKQRMDPKAIQERKEKDHIRYGRGLFQFEMGDKKGGNTASNRLANILDREGIEKPQWLVDIWENKKSVDASKLTADQQKMLFLAYHRDHEKSNFSNIWSGQQSVPEFWSKYHWAGKEDIQGKLDLFNKSMIAKDSTDALKAREEELMYKQNMAPYLSDSNNINNLPKENDILNSIFGTQDSSLVKEYEHGGKHFDFNKTNDYSGENLKDDWLWNNVTKHGLQATKWLGETAIPKSFEELMLMTGGGAAISNIVKQAPKLGRYFSKEIKEGIREGKKLWGNPTIDAASIGKNRVSAVQDVINKNRNYLLSDEYMTKRIANTGESKSQVTKQINNYLRELKQTNISQAPIENPNPNLFTRGQYAADGRGGSKITVNREIDDIDEILQTLDHETKHLLSPVSKVAPSPYGETNIFGKPNPKYQQWLDKRGGNIEEGFVTFKTPKPGEVVTEFGGAYKNYPKIEVNPKHSQHVYLMKPHEQQVRMVRLGEIFKKHGSWDGTAKGLTDDVIKKAFKGVEEVPEDIRLLFGNIKGAKAGSKKWLEIVKKTIPYAWGMAPVATTTLQE